MFATVQPLSVYIFRPWPRTKYPFIFALGQIVTDLNFWRYLRAARKPILLFTFERSLFTLSMNTPAFEPLFQLPPRIGRRYIVLSPYFLAGRFYPAANHATNFA